MWRPMMYNNKGGDNLFSHHTDHRPVLPRPAVMSTCIARLKRAHGVYNDNNTDNNSSITGRYEHDIALQRLNYIKNNRLLDKYEACETRYLIRDEELESRYLSLANNNEETIKLYDVTGDCDTTNAAESKIIVVDMTGNARMKKFQVRDGEPLKEAQHLSLSLRELANFISDLADDTKKCRSYRNSELTHVLQDSLGGNNQLTFLLCVSTTLVDPSETKCSSESKCTIDFGQHIKSVFSTPSIDIGRYEWKYEQEGGVEQGSKEGPKKEKKKRKRSRKVSRKRSDSEHSIEYTNVATEFDQSKTLIEKLQCLMGLKREDLVDKAEDNGISKGNDRTHVQREPDGLLTEGSDGDCLLQEIENIHRTYNVNRSDETSSVTTNNMSETTLHSDDLEPPDVEDEFGESTELNEDITFRNVNDFIYNYDVIGDDEESDEEEEENEHLDNENEELDPVNKTTLQILNSVKHKLEKLSTVIDASLHIPDSIDRDHTIKNSRTVLNNQNCIQLPKESGTLTVDDDSADVSSTVGGTLDINVSENNKKDGTASGGLEINISENNKNDETASGGLKSRHDESERRERDLVRLKKLNTIRNDVRRRMDNSRYVHHVRFGCWCERGNKHSHL